MTDIIRFPRAARPIPPPIDRILAAIRDAPDDQVFRLQTRAIEHFAKLNGWQFGGKKRFVPFDFQTLQDHHFFDHRIIFSGAFVIQPYSFRFWRQKAETVAATQHRPLEVHIAPISIHAPGQCTFVVFTKPGHVMRWLPEQENGFAT